MYGAKSQDRPRVDSELVLGKLLSLGIEDRATDIDSDTITLRMVDGKILFSSG